MCKRKTLADYPELVAQWHPTLNGDLKPEMISHRSGKKYWWKCSKNHEWQTTCDKRTGRFKTGCPYCTGRQLCNDNCLATLFPEIAKEWHSTKNGEITPNDVIAGSAKKIWWQCSKGHEWLTSCDSRTGGRRKCPYCTGHKICNDNCLTTLFPEIAKEWHPTKNGTITPKNVMAGSSKKYFWRCSKGHEWTAPCSSRTRLIKAGCPCCSGNKVCDETCLATLFPEIAKEWHPIKNGKITPNDVMAGSEIKIWWKCLKGHEWLIPCGNRTGKNKSGCPCCAGYKVCDDNCLATLFPEIAKEWHPTKNGKITPNDVVAGTTKKFWWKCQKGHEWKSMCVNRTNKLTKRNCPYCTGNKTCNDNCLATLFPEIAKEWHSTKNGEITPKNVMPGSSCKKYWWQCSKGHEWQSTCGSRTGCKTGCPYCSNNQVCSDNCLETLFPEIAKEWHPTKNGKITPKDVIGGSNKKAWWCCKKGHEWQSVIASRTGVMQCGCPNCRESKGELKIREYLIKNNKNIGPQHRVKNIGIFDFATYNKKIIFIEYHGIQHYTPIRFGSKNKNHILKNFIKNISNDQRKIDYCKSKNIPLLIIPYWDYERIDEILDDFFANKTPTFSEPPQEVKNKKAMRKKIRDRLGIEIEILCGII